MEFLSAGMLVGMLVMGGLIMASAFYWWVIRGNGNESPPPSALAKEDIKVQSSVDDEIMLAIVTALHLNTQKKALGMQRASWDIQHGESSWVISGRIEALSSHRITIRRA